MNRILFPLALLVLIPAAIIQAQIVKVNPEFEAQATELSKKYKTAKVVYTNEIVNYTFEYDSKNDKVTSLKKTESEFLATKENIGYSDVIFYDDQTEIKKVRVRVFNSSMKPYDVYPRYYKYESDGIFYSDAKVAEIDFPLNKIGQKYFYENEILCNDIKYECTAYFHNDEPILEKTITFEIPSWLEIELKEMNFEGFNITKESAPDSKKNVTVIKYKIKSVAGYKSESGSPLRAGVLPHLVILSKKYTTKNGQVKTLFSSSKDLYAWYSSLTKKVENKSSELKPKVDELIKGKSTPVEKIESIYYWVHDHVRYIAFENGIMGFKPEGACNVYNNKYGDCKGMANLLSEMLKLAGFDARLTWIGTRGIPYDYSIPSLIVDNHMICTVILDGKRYFLDGTEDYIAFNDYAHRIQGRPVMIQDGDNFILDKIPEFTYERNKEEEVSTYSLNGDKIIGKTKQILNGEGKTNFLRGFASIASDKKDESLKNYVMQSNNNIQITTITNSDLDNRQKPVELNYEYQISNQVMTLDNELYVDFLIDKDFGDADMDSLRENDYVFYNKVYRTTKAEFTVPAGYKVSHVADKISIKHPDFIFELEYTQAGNKITYTKNIIIPNAYLKKKDFKEWNVAIKKLKAFYNDQIVLVKGK